MVLAALLAALAQRAQQSSLTLDLGRAQHSPSAVDAHIEDFIPHVSPRSTRETSAMVGHSSFQAYIWKQALLEENMTVGDVSYYGRQAVKFPRSWVSKVRKLGGEKTRNYNFIGREENTFGYRWWAMAFAEDNFAASDYFEFTRLNHVDSIWTGPIGPFDHTGQDRHYDAAIEDPLKGAFDETYYRVITSSNFTLCPRGDRSFSERFLDAILGRSIPIVNSLGVDMDSPFSMMTSVPYHYYALADKVPIVHRQDWVEENARLFIRYNTFMEGDNVPEGWVPPPGMKEAIEIADGIRGTEA
uniref:Exostosin GT47 domain-containing protein n=1 Tax=Alexandrium catenella TaxID=2925 RepID=A0A7S1S7L5_ALECA|mmetsp:Transcript_89606/g.237996  ORF Transcript_89606/g.237996 Transcript_89606/m.237996 type:complete len:300 (+) Transcript_89606:82-981(+)